MATQELLSCPAGILPSPHNSQNIGSDQQALGPMVVVINGFPGAGKLTILKKVKEQLEGQYKKGNIFLLDNHTLIDPVQALLPERSAKHYALRRQIRQLAFSVIAEQVARVEEGNVYLMTACLAEGNDIDAGCFQEHMELVRGTTVTLLWINAHCDIGYLKQRVSSPERREGHKSKLTDSDVLENLVRNYRLIDPQSTSNNLPNLITRALDVSGLVESSTSMVMNMMFKDS